LVEYKEQITGRSVINIGIVLGNNGVWQIDDVCLIIIVYG
jgi:hypothetical protein